MNRKLGVNICRLTDQIMLNDEISDLRAHLDEYVPEDLAYSCQFWCQHLEHVLHPDSELLSLLHEFCGKHLLHWLEVMSLRAETSAIMAIQNMEKWLHVSVRSPLMSTRCDVLDF
jgi:hypothetical protein